MKGIYPIKYFKTPLCDKPLEEIWDDIDAYTGEFFEDEPQHYDKIDLFVPLPPLKHQGKFIKGILFTQALDFLLKLYPNLKDLFFVGAYSMWSSYPWCDKADFYLSCYENKKREEYHKNKYQNKKDIIFIPLQDADFTQEKEITKLKDINKKEIDVLSVATPYPVKNLPVIAYALKIYKEKYKKRLKATMVLGKNEMSIKNGIIDCSALSKEELQEMNKMKDILDGDYHRYINFIPSAGTYKITQLYNKAKCLVLASLIEGKNRAYHEAMACDTPVILFKDHNKWARDKHPLFFGNSGEIVEHFNPESLADAIHKVINNPENYSPRENFLKHSGRKTSLNTLANYLPYYKDNIPNYQENIYENEWINKAIKENYGFSFEDILYENETNLTHKRGLEEIKKILDFYFDKFKN